MSGILKKNISFFSTIAFIFLLVVNSQSLAFYPEDEETPQKYRTVLTIAGSDPSGGAGVQADLKTFTSLGCYGMSVITTLTAQNTMGVQDILPVSREFVRAQLKSVFDDMPIDVIKIGLLGNAELIEEVADFLQKNKRPEQKIVVDPVMFAKSGDRLLNDDVANLLKDKIIPLATVITPNLREASFLANRTITTEKDVQDTAYSLLELGPEAVIVKGGTLQSDDQSVYDFFVRKGNFESGPCPYKKINTPNIHGAGCTFSAAVASYLAHAYGTWHACQHSLKYTRSAIEQGAKYKIGQGHGPLCHFYGNPKPIDFTQKIWLKTIPIYEKIKEHPFIQELASGKLSKDIFSFYILQDHLFLTGRANAFSQIAISDLEIVEYVVDLAVSTRKSADGIFSKYNLERPSAEDLQMSPACKAYTEYMLHNAKKGLTEGIISLLPCTLIYQKIGEYIKSLSPENNPYKAWIDSYSSPERRQRVLKFIQHADMLASQASAEEMPLLESIFEEASQFEYNFWDDAYHQRKRTPYK